jgi:hypothetical protein
LDKFNTAAVANQWPNDKRIPIAAEYLKEAALEWAQGKAFEYWDDGTDDNIARSFSHQFLAYFSPETKQNKWYYKLITIR